MAAIAFSYSDGEPMRYAEVLVFSPEDRKVEHQNARTDRHGRFAFCPDIPGTWLVTASDGMGHLSEATVQVRPRAVSGETEKPQDKAVRSRPAEGSKAFKILLGLSLILNVTFAARFFSQRSQPADMRSG